MYAKLKCNRNRILILLYRHRDLRSRDIREQTRPIEGEAKTTISACSKTREVIEVVGRNDDSGGDAERVFGLTDDGIL